jgi:YHS domain-containing protein
MILKRVLGYATRLLVTTLALVGCATKPGQIWQDTPVPPIDARASLGLEGYDVVAYFTDHRPIKGSDAFTSEWQGVTWRFASPEHRDLFAANPMHYAPQYGGYCAYAVSHGTTAHGDPNQWAVVDDRLFVNNNPLARKLWESQRSRNIRVGDVNWPLIPKVATPAGGAPPALPAAPGAEGAGDSH